MRKRRREQNEKALMAWIGEERCSLLCYTVRVRESDANSGEGYSLSLCHCQCVVRYLDFRAGVGVGGVEWSIGPFQRRIGSCPICGFGPLILQSKI
jgi:hypothetical protein